MVQWFPLTDIWTLKNLKGYQLWWLFEKINFQGWEKLILQSMSPNEFGEVPHTIGRKTPLGTVC